MLECSLDVCISHDTLLSSYEVATSESNLDHQLSIGYEPCPRSHQTPSKFRSATSFARTAIAHSNSVDELSHNSHRLHTLLSYTSVPLTSRCHVYNWCPSLSDRPRPPSGSNSSCVSTSTREEVVHPVRSRDRHHPHRIPCEKPYRTALLASLQLSYSPRSSKSQKVT